MTISLVEHFIRFKSG